MKTTTKEILNSIILGIIFMLLYSAFYTLSNLEEILIHSIQQEVIGFKGDGYTNLLLLYTSFAVFIWFVPPIVNVIGPKWALALGSVGYCVPLVALLQQQSWFVYFSSVCNGVSAAVLWTSQAVYIMYNSTSATIGRNTAIFSGICHSSMIYGNVFVYFCFEGKTVIDEETRTSVLFGLLGLTVFAATMSTLLPSPAYIKENSGYQGSALEVMKQSWAVAKTKEMTMLIPMFLYCGIQLSYLSGIFGAAVGFTSYCDGFPANQLVTITGLCSGIGEILGGVFLFVVNPLLRSRTWSVIVAIGIFSECIAYLLSFLNYSNDSVFHPTNEPTIISSRWWIAAVSALLLGFGDAIFMPMLMSVIKKIYSNGNASTLTVYTFCFVSCNLF
ncbi:UNC93-like protein MFSD11 [Macrosteles quadrilineatus]|uniref:UNC93-like protein MFSD11 n=1 Tax=Macrosteles quadrilineatus TaxID=74068 RepID=UPI0023E1267F|nr:UNC93-like protein MFSD11 [Macrosteles quadrilineatus]